MIKTFETTHNCWGKKFNAIDDKNNLVGFSLDNDCCAVGGWFIAPEVTHAEPELKTSYILDDYAFDLDFFKEISGLQDYDDFRAVVLRMVSDGKPDLYLHLYNCHNGYYSKGFERSWGEIREASV